MISKAQSKYIRALSFQKYRIENQCFLIEGEKIISEWIQNASQSVKLLFGTTKWLDSNRHLLNVLDSSIVNEINEDELKQISNLQTPNKVIAVVQKSYFKPQFDLNATWTIALDNLQDPGNMGTIIRNADWFGVNQIVCSKGCTDCFSPKVIQAAMGAHIRVPIYENVDLESYLKNTTIKSIAATLNGSSIYNLPIINSGIIIIGNESKGISEPIKALTSLQATIPGYGGAESLNAAVSSGILCAFLIKPHS